MEAFHSSQTMSVWGNSLRKYAPPVSQDGFLHSGDSFYVEIDRHHHSRLDSGALHDLLTYTDPPPLLTKAGKVAKRQRMPHIDPPGHFYVAQLAHYGLKSFKTKPAAKKHLLAAFNSTKTLAVPRYILGLEKLLGEQYTRENAIAAGKHKEEEDRKKTEEANKQKIQQADRNAVLKEFADMGVVLGHRSGGNTDVARPKAISDTQLRDDLSKLTDKVFREMITNMIFTTRTLKKAIVEELAKKAKVAPAKSKKEKKSGVKLDAMDIRGKYRMLAPYLSQEWPGQTQVMIITIAPSPEESHLWVSFDFGIVSGIMRSCGPPPTSVGDVVDFFWRGQEGTGETTYGGGNVASITFIGGGKIKGNMKWKGEFDFAGRKAERELERHIAWCKYVTGWKSEWEGIDGRSYERANTSRWGGGGWYDDNDDGGSERNRTSDSDTDEGAQGMYDSEEEDGGEEDYDMRAFG